MYEIWLVINTFYELALANLGLVLSALGVWLVLMLVTQLRKQLSWGQGIKAAVVVGLVAWAVLFAMLPSLTNSSFAAVNSIVDWLTVAGVSAAFAALVALFIGPIYLLIKR